MLKIDKIKIKDFTFYENNARFHNSVSSKRLQRSIEEFGYNAPVGVYGAKNEIVYGHGRVAALRSKYGENKEIECVRLDHLSEEQVREFRLVENQTQALTGFDEVLLAKELENILNFDMKEFGVFDKLPKLEAPGEEVCCPECGMVFDAGLKRGRDCRQ